MAALDYSGKEIGSTCSHDPYLVYSYGKNSKMKAICCVSDKNHKPPEIICELYQKIIWCSYLDWLLVEDKKSEIFYLLNIDSKEKVKLPKLDPPEHKFCLLSSGPDNPHCHVICMTNSNDANNVITMCKPGENQNVISIWESDGEHDIFAATFFDGKLYCLLIPDYTMIVADLAHATTTNSVVIFKQVIGEMPRPSRHDFPQTHNYLVDADDELLLVHKRCLYHMDEVLHFRVFKADFSRKIWVETESIGDRTIFLSDEAGCCRSATQTGTQHNCIYFTQVGDGKLHIFDLEDQSISSTLPCEIVGRKDVDSIWAWKKDTNFMYILTS